MVRKAQELRPVMTRIPEGLRRRLEREAALNRRSMNSEIVHRLEESFRRHDTEAMMRQAMDRLTERFRSLLSAGFEPTQIKPATAEHLARVAEAQKHDDDESEDNQ
jgi:hypothetical protein